MKYHQLALVGVLAALSAGVAACTSSTSSTTTTSTTTNSTSGASLLPKRGVVTITMAIVGDPGNPSVGVIQTFGGPKGEFVDPPAEQGKHRHLQELQ